MHARARALGLGFEIARSGNLVAEDRAARSPGQKRVQRTPARTPITGSSLQETRV